MRIVKLKLTNFKRFQEEEISFERPMTILVGKNNSGKSSIVYALADFLGINVPFINPQLNKKLNGTGTVVRKIWLELAEQEWKNLIQLQQHNFDGKKPNFEKILPRLKKSYLTITLTGSYVDGTNASGFPRTIELTGENPLTSFESDEQFILNRSISNANPSILNAIGRVTFLSSERMTQAQEKFIPYNELKEKENAYQFIRNSLYVLKRKRPEKFTAILTRIKSIFPDIEDMDVILNEDTGLVDVEITENNIVSDIDEMGSGTKSLLLVLARILQPTTTIALLDEPDINMHPGLVRDFANFLSELSINCQIIMTSHHETFVNEITRESILHVHSIGELSSGVNPLDESGGIVKVLDDLGIYQENFSRTEVIASKVVVFGEGPTDWSFIQEFSQKLGLSLALTKIDPYYYALGGRRIVDSKLIDELNGSRKPFVLIIDHDESTQEEITAISNKIGSDRLHVLKRREIENYALDYQAILDLIKSKGEKKSQEIKNRIDALQLDDITNKIFELSIRLKNKVILLRFIRKLPFLKLLSNEEIGNFIENNYTKNIEDAINAFSANIFQKITILNPSELITITKGEEDEINKIWNKENILKICPGKDLVKLINKWLVTEYGINFSPKELIEHLKTVDEDIKILINKIINTSKIS